MSVLDKNSEIKFNSRAVDEDLVEDLAKLHIHLSLNNSKALFNKQDQSF